MTIDVGEVQTFVTTMKVLIDRMNALPQPIQGGRAAALGTLTSMHRRINTLLVASGTRALNAVDRADFARNASNLRWLKETDWIHEAFAGVGFDVGGGDIEYVEAINVLEASLGEALKMAA